MDSNMVKSIKCTTLPRDKGGTVLYIENLTIILHKFAIRNDQKKKKGFIYNCICCIIIYSLGKTELALTRH